MTPPKDFDRLAENLYTNEGKNIYDEESFETAYRHYLLGNNIEDDPVFMSRAKKKYKEKYGLEKTSLHRKAGGRNLARDRRKTASRVVTTPKDYIKYGASRVDLKGYDTKMKDKYKLLGFSKGKVIRVRKTFIKVKGKRKAVYRDSKGRFASFKKR